MPGNPSPAAATGATPQPLHITVALESQPLGARVVRVRDQAVIGVTPFKATWPSAAGTERLRVELAGYRSESLVVPLDRGAELRLTLVEQPRPTHPAAKRAGGPRHRAPARTAEPVPL